MNRDFGWKLIVILGTLLVFIYGIFGVPSGVSGSALLSALQNRINLGLDLKGGTHLILQVHVNDAINVDTDNAIEILKAGMRSAKVNYAEISKPDPGNHPEQIVIKGVAPESSADLRSLVQDKLPDYDATSGANNTWTVTMKPTVLTDTKERAVQQAIQTIDNRINE